MATAEYHRDYYAKNREKEIEKVKRWQRNHAEQVLTTRRANSPARRATMRLVRYGLTDERYQLMLVEQDGKCVICQREMNPPHVDHDHATGRVRGLLCDNCNRGIGHLKEDVASLKRAIDYLGG